MQIRGDVKIYNSLNFENFANPSVQSLHTAKRNLSTRGIRKISHFEVAINTIQSWLCLVKHHHSQTKTCDWKTLLYLESPCLARSLSKPVDRGHAKNK